MPIRKPIIFATLCGTLILAGCSQLASQPGKLDFIGPGRQVALDRFTPPDPPPLRSREDLLREEFATARISLRKILLGETEPPADTASQAVAMQLHREKEQLDQLTVPQNLPEAQARELETDARPHRLQPWLAQGIARRQEVLKTVEVTGQILIPEGVLLPRGTVFPTGFLLTPDHFTLLQQDTPFTQVGIAGMVLRALGPDGQELGQALSGEAGFFRLSKLPSGLRLELRAEHPVLGEEGLAALVDIAPRFEAEGTVKADLTPRTTSLTRLVRSALQTGSLPVDRVPLEQVEELTRSALETLLPWETVALNAAMWNERLKVKPNQDILALLTPARRERVKAVRQAALTFRQTVFQQPALASLDVAILTAPVVIDPHQSPPPGVPFLRPNPPVGLAAGELAHHRFNLRWLPVAGASGYNLYLDGALYAGNVQSTAFSLVSSLQADTFYSLTVTALNPAGESEPSIVLRVQTLPLPGQGAALEGSRQSTGLPAPSTPPAPAATPGPAAPSSAPPVPREIIFSSDRNGNRDLYLMDLDGANLIRATQNDGDDTGPRWAGQDRQVAFTANRDGNSEVYLLAPNNVFKQTNLSAHASTDSLPAWSPDSLQMAFVSDRSGNSEIYTTFLADANPLNITQNAGSDTSPAWSPNGQRLAFVSTRDGNNEVYVIESIGINPINLSFHASSDTSPAWAPDGAMVAYVSTRDGNEEIYSVSSFGGKPVRLTQSGGSDTGPVWSPDGTKLAFVSLRDGNQEIYLMNADGSNPVNLTAHSAADHSPAWLPQGDRLVFVSERDGNAEIYIINADGSNPVNLSKHAGRDDMPAVR